MSARQPTLNEERGRWPFFLFLFLSTSRRRILLAQQRHPQTNQFRLAGNPAGATGSVSPSRAYCACSALSGDRRRSYVLLRILQLTQPVLPLDSSGRARPDRSPLPGSAAPPHNGSVLSTSRSLQPATQPQPADRQKSSSPASAVTIRQTERQMQPKERQGIEPPADQPNRSSQQRASRPPARAPWWAPLGGACRQISRTDLASCRAESLPTRVNRRSSPGVDEGPLQRRAGPAGDGSQSGSHAPRPDPDRWRRARWRPSTRSSMRRWACSTPFARSIICRLLIAGRENSACQGSVLAHLHPGHGGGRGPCSSQPSIICTFCSGPAIRILLQTHPPGLWHDPATPAAAPAPGHSETPPPNLAPHPNDKRLFPHLSHLSWQFFPRR